MEEWSGVWTVEHLNFYMGEKLGRFMKVRVMRRAWRVC